MTYELLAYIAMMRPDGLRKRDCLRAAVSMAKVYQRVNGGEGNGHQHRPEISACITGGGRLALAQWAWRPTTRD
jgi:hypothetical protein